MRIPYVIDKETHRLADVLNAVLAERAGRSLDVATAYFTVSGYAQVRERGTVLSQEELGRDTFEPQPWGDCDVVLVDEAHNFRNPNANRYGNLERVLGANGGRGRDGARKKGIVAEPQAAEFGGEERTTIRREDLRLICFEFLSGG